jgi:hypothetical protein
MRESCQPVAKGCRNNVVEIKQAPRLASEELGLGMRTAVSQKDHCHMKSEEKSSVLQNLRCLSYQRTKECNQHRKHKEEPTLPMPSICQNLSWKTHLLRRPKLGSLAHPGSSVNILLSGLLA